MNNEEIVPEKMYHVHLLNEDLQKQGESVFTVKNVRISPSGVLEADRVWSDVPFVTKIFYKGEFLLTQMGEEEIAQFYEHEHEGGEE